jgi:DNA invertase Pin-like site-specific DNA recombinase
MESRLDSILCERGYHRLSKFTGLMTPLTISCEKGHCFDIYATELLKPFHCEECKQFKNSPTCINVKNIEEPVLIDINGFETVYIQDNEDKENNCLIKKRKITSSITKPLMVAYCRVSSEMQRNNHSITNQEDSATRYAEENGYFLWKIYEDIALSGKSINTRKALQLLLSELESSTTVFFYSITRMSRNVRDVNDIVDKIHSKKCTFISLDLPKEATGPSANLFLNILATMSQFERETTSKRVSDVMKNLSSKGDLRSKPPFGYKFVGKNKPYEKEPIEQEIILYMKNLVENNPCITPTEISRILEYQGMKIRKCKKIYPNRVKEILLQNGII